MKPIKTISKKIETVRNYDRSIKLFLTVPVLFGLYFAVKGLFFNFYILGLGYDKAYLGLANSMTPAATLILAFPLGVLTDRIGRKRSVLTGMIIIAVSYLAFLFTTGRTMILVTLFISGIGETLYFVSATPLLTRLTTKENRVAIFSLRAALFTFSGVFGSYIGGQMPLWIDTLFAIPAGSVESYRGVLLTSFFILLLTLIPTWMIPPGDRSSTDSQAQAGTVQDGGGSTRTIVKNMQIILRKKIIWQLFIPNLLIGLGAALMVPYLNLFLVETFGITDQTLGTLFSIAALLTGVGTLFSPWLARRLGNRIRALVLAQGSSLFFLLLLGFSPILGLAVIGFWGRNALMNMAQPLYNAFSMDQVADNEQDTLSSMLTLSWQTGWALMPTISGFIQVRYGFTPIFITTAVLYALSTILIWIFFSKSEEVIPVKTTAPVL
jgi:MFS family permease